MSFFKRKIVIETNGLKILLNSICIAFIVFICILLFVRPSIIKAIYLYYEKCVINGTKWYDVWYYILPFILVIGLLIGFIRFILLYNKNNIKSKKKVK